MQYMRLIGLRNQLPQMPTWRWRVLHSPADAPRFMITDRGWVYVGGQENWQSYGLIFPMSPRVAILGYLDDPRLPPRQPAFSENFDLVPSSAHRRRSGRSAVVSIGLRSCAIVIDLYSERGCPISVLTPFSGCG